MSMSMSIIASLSFSLSKHVFYGIYYNILEAYQTALFFFFFFFVILPTAKGISGNGDSN
jgi:hypothetical protein